MLSKPRSKVAWLRGLSTACLKTRSVEVRHRQHFLLIQVKPSVKHSVTTAAAKWDSTE